MEVLCRKNIAYIYMKKFNIYIKILATIILILFMYLLFIDREKKENFGERYTQPKEKRSEVKTSLLGGLTVMPTKHFDVHFLFSPYFHRTYMGTEFKEFQWWIDFNIYF